MLRLTVLCTIISLVLAASVCAQAKLSVKAVSLNIEAEESVFTYQYAPTGAGPTWCFGSAVMVRMGDRLFASGQVPVPGVTGINCVRPTLYERTSKGWQLIYTDPGNTREPSPIVALSKDKLLMSTNPNDAGPTDYDGVAHPSILAFDTKNSSTPSHTLTPIWDTEIAFHGHSYRCFASDSKNREFFLSWNIAYDRTYWTYYDRKGKWAKQGELMFPMENAYPKPEPLRLCYSPVLLKDRAVHFFGTVDIEEPIQEWRDTKFEISKSKWDYVFRRLFYCYTTDITKKPFSKWIELTNLDKTAGNAFAMDIHRASNGDIYLLWQETSTDYRLRDKFFPGTKMTNTLKCAALRKGTIISTYDISKGGDGAASDESPSWGRFHITPKGRLFVVYTVSVTAADGKTNTRNRIREIFSNQTVGKPIDLDLKHVFGSTFFITSPRSGSTPSEYIELFGNCLDTGNELRYAKIHLKE